MTMRSTPTPRASRRSRRRSGVSGRAVTTPFWAKAMAVASTGPMKIGRTRCWPSASRRRTIGLLVGISTRTPTRCISTIRPTLPRVERPDIRVRVVLEHAQLADHDLAEVAVALGEVEAVAEHELVADLEGPVADGGGDDAARRAVEQGAGLQRPGLATAQL